MRKITAILVALAAGLVLAATATAGDSPMPQLDAFASEIAGKPVHVWCETDWAAWDQVAYGGLIGSAVPGHYLGGFTDLAQPVVYINPAHCEAFQLALTIGPFGYYDVGLAYYANALLVLSHEAVHQRGISDEAQTECTALPLGIPMAIKHLGLPAVVKRTKVVKVRKKIGKRFFVVPVTRTVSVANPDLARLQNWIALWHKTTPPQYQVGC
jgi:hypothetical protein